MSNVSKSQYQYEYDFRMSIHRVTDKKGRVVLELTDEQLIAAGTEVLKVLQEITTLFVDSMTAVGEAFYDLAKSFGLKTTPYEAARFQSKSVKKAKDERAILEARCEIARLNNPGIGMQGIQDRIGAQKGD